MLLVLRDYFGYKDSLQILKTRFWRMCVGIFVKSRIIYYYFLYLLTPDLNIMITYLIL